MKKIIVTAAFIAQTFFVFVGYGQKLKTEQITYSYTRLPALPVKGITNYQVSFEAAYEAKNQQSLKDYNDQKMAAVEKYRKDVASYEIMVKAANDHYDKEMAEYNKKSFGSKLAEKSLLDNNRPIRETVTKPYISYVPEPKLQSSYDYKIMANTYIQLDGYHNNPAEEALKIIVVLYGYDHTQPRTMDEQQENLKIGGSAGTTTYKSTNYHVEFSYRHPMAVKVYTPDGKEILSLTPPELNSYKIYKSAASDQPTRINSELLVKTTEEKVLQDNLHFINNLLNDRYGFSSIKRVATLFYVKDLST